jgi:hypothetical protein
MVAVRVYGGRQADKRIDVRLSLAHKWLKESTAGESETTGKREGAEAKAEAEAEAGAARAGAPFSHFDGAVNVTVSS